MTLDLPSPACSAPHPRGIPLSPTGSCDADMPVGSTTLQQSNIKLQVLIMSCMYDQSCIWFNLQVLSRSPRITIVRSFYRNLRESRECNIGIDWMPFKHPRAHITKIPLIQLEFLHHYSTSDEVAISVIELHKTITLQCHYW